MGDYEDRYPEAYGRGEEKPLTTQDALKQAQTPRQTRDAASAAPQRLNVGMPLEPQTTARMRPAWNHTRATDAPSPIEPTSAKVQQTAGFRGIGPRGYLRSPARIYEDICDRLTENPFIDASDIEVSVAGAEVVLRGRVDSMTALRQAEEIAQETAGVAQIRNELTVQQTQRQSDSPGAQVNRAMGTPRR